MPGPQGSYVWRDHMNVLHADLSHGPQVNSETLHHGVRSFGFLVARNESLTAAEFASRIERHYSVDNPQTDDVVRSFRRCND